MRKSIFLVPVAAACIFLLAFAAPGERGRVKKVLDGDTIVLENGDLIRYLCVDSPEEGEPFHDEAKRVNDSLVFGKVVRVEFDRKVKDRYGRCLGYVWLDTLLVNNFLVKRGLASVYYFPPNDHFLACFVATAKAARGKKSGIWILPHSHLAYYIGNKNSYRVHRPECPQIRGIKPKNRVEFKNLFDAADAGFAFCHICKP